MCVFPCIFVQLEVHNHLWEDIYGSVCIYIYKTIKAHVALSECRLEVYGYEWSACASTSISIIKRKMII